jgi:hypothetical protein
MTFTTPACIADLSERVKQAVESERNRAKGKTQPAIGVTLEEPIASALLFGYDVNRFFSDPSFYIEQSLRQKLWRWEHIDDDVPLTLDIPTWLGYYTEFTCVGLAVSFTAQGVPIVQTDHPLSRDPDLRLLEPVDFYSSGWMPRALRWYDDIYRLADGRVKVVFNTTWFRGCLDLAVQLRGYSNLMADTMERPTFVHNLLRFLVEQRCRWFDAYYRHFGLPVEPVSIADDWINVPFITPRIFEEFVLPRYLEIEQYHGGITGIHSCGNQTPLHHLLLQIKSLRGLEVSPWTDLEQTLVNAPAAMPVGISLHPNDVLCATPEEMESKLRFITTACKGRKYGIHTSGLTPIRESSEDFSERIRTWLGVARKVLGRA